MGPFLRDGFESGLISVLYDRQDLQLLPGGVSIPGGVRSVRQGDFLARIATPTNNPPANAGKYIVAKYSEVSVDVANTNTFQVNDAHPFAVGDVVDIGGVSNRTITSINYATNMITVSGGAFSPSATDDVLVSENEMSEAVGVALLPSRDKDAVILGGGAADITPREGDHLEGAVAITGRFYLDKLKNFRLNNSNNIFESFPRKIVLSGVGPEGVIIISEPSNHLQF